MSTWHAGRLAPASTLDDKALTFQRLPDAIAVVALAQIKVTG